MHVLDLILKSFFLEFQISLSEADQQYVKLWSILGAENEHLVTISIFITQDVRSGFERKLLDAFSSDSFSDAAKAWNAERSLVVEEMIEQHLIPAGTKWTREFIWEEVEDYLTEQCNDCL